MAGDLEQGIASDAAKTQTLLDKEFDKDDADDDTHYTLEIVQQRSVWRESTFHVNLEPWYATRK